MRTRRAYLSLGNDFVRIIKEATSINDGGRRGTISNDNPSLDVNRYLNFVTFTQPTLWYIWLIIPSITLSNIEKKFPHPLPHPIVEDLPPANNHWLPPHSIDAIYEWSLTNDVVVKLIKIFSNLFWFNFFLLSAASGRPFGSFLLDWRTLSRRRCYYARWRRRRRRFWILLFIISGWNFEKNFIVKLRTFNLLSKIKFTDLRD